MTLLLDSGGTFFCFQSKSKCLGHRIAAICKSKCSKAQLILLFLRLAAKCQKKILCSHSLINDEIKT